MSNRRSHLILVGLILAALVGVALLAIPSSPAHKKVTLGLDLQGGLEVVLKAVPPPGKTCDSACMDRSVSIMRSRIDKLGVSEPEIRKQGKDQIVIQLAGVHDVNKAAQIIGTTAQLQFYDFETDAVGPVERRRGARDRDRQPLRPADEGEGRHEERRARSLLPLQREEEAGRRPRGHARAAAQLDAAERPQAERQGARRASRCWRCRPSRS